MDNQIHTNMLNGLLSDCEPFRKWLEQEWFAVHRVCDEDKWWIRDQLSAAWDAGVDAVCGVTLTREERRKRAEELDQMRKET